MTAPRPLHVLVAGGGVAGLEALLALRDLAGDRVELTLLTPQDDFVYWPLSVTEPFAQGHAQHVSLRDVARDLRARFSRVAVIGVDEESGTVTTSDGNQLCFDELVLAVGARTREAAEPVVTWTPEADREIFGGLLRDIDDGSSKRIAFIVPADAAWPLPAYELALLTAGEARAMGHDDVEIVLITAEEAPLGVFGTKASDAVARELQECGIEVRTGVDVVAVAAHGELVLGPGAERLRTDRVVALPVVVGPSVPGVPADLRGFITTDEHGRVRDTEHIWAAGDGTAFPTKQGGLATQEADAVAEAIAARAGAPIDPRPFRPVLRGVLLTGDHQRWMRHDLNGAPGDGVTATHTLWWPPTKVSGRYLSPYLAALDDAAAIGATTRPPGVPVELDIERELAMLGEHAGELVAR